MKDTPSITASVIFCLAFCTASDLQAQQRVRAIVQFHDDARFADYAADFTPEPRVTASDGSTYHRRDVVGAAQRLERSYRFRARHFYSHAIKGFAADLTRAELAALERDPLVQKIEIESPISVGLISVTSDPAQLVTWGIPKIGADISSTRSGDGSGTISGPPIFILDTGVDVTHPDINVVAHVSLLSGPNTDCNGHGTAVAGIAAARDNGIYTVGVAPGAPVIGVRVFSCEGIGLPSTYIQALDWLTAVAPKPSVVNLSFGSAIPLEAANAAVRAAAASGLFIAVAAGNGNPFTGEPMDACLTSPAGGGYFFGFPNGVVTTAATDMDDAEAAFSNYGACVDLWAPGVSLTSTWLMSEGGLITASGTSFSSPYVAGAAALLLSRYPTLSPPLVELILQYVATDTGTTSKDARPIRRLSVRLF